MCESLETTSCVTDAVACSHQIPSELAQEIDEQVNWIHGKCPHVLPRHHCDHPLSDFKVRSCSKLKHLRDSAVNAKQYNKAISYYMIVLLLDPASPQDLLVKQSKVLDVTGIWKDVLNNTNKVACFQFPQVHDVNGYISGNQA